MGVATTSFEGQKGSGSSTPQRGAQGRQQSNTTCQHTNSHNKSKLSSLPEPPELRVANGMFLGNKNEEKSLNILQPLQVQILHHKWRWVVNENRNTELCSRSSRQRISRNDDRVQYNNVGLSNHINSFLLNHSSFKDSFYR